MKIAEAGNTENPAFLVIQNKGYSLSSRIIGDNEIGYAAEFYAEKNGLWFSASGGPALLGLIAMWEARGSDWQTRDDEDCIFGKLPDHDDEKPLEKTKVGVIDRIREILGRDNVYLDEVKSFTYEYQNNGETSGETTAGYEKLDKYNFIGGAVHFAGVFHPNVVCEGENICKYCGIVLTLP